MQNSEKAWGVCAIILAGLAASILYHSFVGLVLGLGYPSNTFLFRPHVSMFSDFYVIFEPVQNGSPLGSKLAVYFPFAYVPLYPFIWMSASHAFLAAAAIFSACTYYFFWNCLDSFEVRQRALAAAILTFGSYPSIFCITRGNLEMIVLLFTFAFIWQFRRGRYLSAAVLLACATAMKLYPGALGVLLLQKRQYKASALTAVLTLTLTLASAAMFPGGIQGTMELLNTNLLHFKEEVVLGDEAISFSSGYFSALKLMALAIGSDASDVARAAILPYTAFSLVLFSVVAIFVLRRERALWRQVSLLSCLMILLPEVSFDYKLVHLFIGLGLFVAAPPGNVRDDRVYTVLFGLLLVPKAYGPIGSENTIGVLLNPLLMTLLTAHILWEGFRGRREVVPSG